MCITVDIWTQLGCAISQFELHLRALLDLPTPSLQPIAPSVMVNLIGTEHNPQWLNNAFLSVTLVW